MEPETNLEIITRYYEDILQLSGTELTAADRADIASYAATVDSGALTLADARAALIASPAGEQVQDVVRLYQVVFGRVPDQAGLNFQVDATRAGFSIEGIAVGFSNSAEFETRFGTNTVNTAFINAVYQQTLGRTPAASEVQFYLDSGFSAGRIALAFAESPEFVGNTQDAVEEFLDSAAQGTQDYEGSLGGGTGPINPGETRNFTDAVGETVNGTAGDDTFNGVVQGANNNGGTINIGDTLNGLGGRDTLNVTFAGAASGLPSGATVSGVEVVNLNISGGVVIDPVNSNTFAGVEELWQIDNDGVDSFANVTVGSEVTAGFRSTGNGATASAAVVTVTAAAGVTSTAVALDGVDDGSNITFAETTANGLSSVSVSGSVATTAAIVGVDANNDGDFTDPGDTAPVAASNVLTLTATAADVDTLNLGITSNSTITLTGFDDLNTLDASDSTGNLTFTLGTPDELATATFGSGNDTVTYSSASQTNASVAIDLGAGNDVLNIAAANNAADTTVNITLGDGNDTVRFTALANITDPTDIASDLVTVADFNGAADVLILTALGTRDVLTNTELANISGAADLQAAVTAAAAVTTGYSIFEFGGDTYVFDNNNGAEVGAGDGLVKLTGVAIADLTDSSLVA